MNPYVNPWFLSRLLRSYLFDINRLKHLNAQELEQLQVKRLRYQVRRAMSVPVYHDLYRKVGVDPSSITTISDVAKLPFITKHELKKGYPNGILPRSVQQDHMVEVATSGTTGKSLTIFVDQYDIVMGLFGYLRSLREYKLSWLRNRIAIIGDFASHTAESGYIRRGLEPRFKFRFLFKNILWLDTNADPKENMRSLEEFKPDFIGGYVGMLGHLALLKDQGYGKTVEPKYIASTGAVLDPNLKQFIETAFQTQVYEAYGATETGPIAFECREGGYHVLSDLIHVEVVDKEKPVSPGSPGHLIVTKLFGYGTPIIRYTAINDIVSLKPRSCSCGMPGILIDRIYGRDDLSLLLPHGKVLLPATVAGIYSRVLYKLKTTKLKDTRLIQHDMNNLEIQIVVDDQKKTGPSTQAIKDVLVTGFKEKLGKEVHISISEVEKLGDHERRIISHVDPSSFTISGYI